MYIHTYLGIFRHVQELLKKYQTIQCRVLQKLLHVYLCSQIKAIFTVSAFHVLYFFSKNLFFTPVVFIQHKSTLARGTGGCEF